MPEGSGEGCTAHGADDREPFTISGPGSYQASLQATRSEGISERSGVVDRSPKLTGE